MDTGQEIKLTEYRGHEVILTILIQNGKNIQIQILEHWNGVFVPNAWSHQISGMW